MITGYADTFQRTSSNGWGTSSSGHVYTLYNGASSAYSVAAGVGSIAMTTTGNYDAAVDRQTSDIDITGQVALSAIPSTNLATAGFTAKQSTNQNYYIGSFMVQTVGLMSLRISKVVSGSLITLNSTLIPGLGTYTAGTYFNIRFQCYWSNLLQTNVLNIKVWAIGGTEPGGWLVSITDSSITQYASGTQAGVHARDEQTSPNITARFQNVVAKTYGLPVPASTDPMCQDPAVAYPDQTAIQSLAVAADSALITLDPLADLAALYPRVRVSANNVSYNMAALSTIQYDTTEFNIGTSTNLGYDNQQVYLPVGLWVLSAEIRLAVAADNPLYMDIYGGSGPSQGFTNFRSHTQQGVDSIGGTGHTSMLTWNTDPSSPIQCGIQFGSFASQPIYTIVYAALTAIKISDYFT